MSTRFSVLCIALILVGCGYSEEPHSPAPRLDFECSITMGDVCAPDKAGSMLFVGLTTDLNINCASRISFYTGMHLFAQFDFISMTTMENRGTYLLGRADEWSNYAQAPMVSLPVKPVQVCAFIDLNDNGQLDIGEPLHDSLYTIGNSFQPFSTWVVQ